MLKHLPEKALKVIENDLLYSKKKVKLFDSEDRRDERTNDANADNRTDVISMKEFKNSKIN